MICFIQVFTTVENIKFEKDAIFRLRKIQWCTITGRLNKPSQKLNLSNWSTCRRSRSFKTNLFNADNEPTKNVDGEGKGHMLKHKLRT